jgi:hypothetical protein
MVNKELQNRLFRILEIFVGCTPDAWIQSLSEVVSDL